MIPHSRPFLDAGDVLAVQRAIASGQIAQGRRVREFETKVAALLRQRDGVAVSSGTSALHLGLLALGVGPGDAVAIPSYSCVALLHAVEYVGARPLIIDKARDDCNLSLSDLRRKVLAARSSIAAAIVPHMFGRVCDLDEIRAVLGEVPIIEDIAHAIGDPALGGGDLLACSFYATKMMTTGEGGMLLSRDSTLLDAARDMRDYDEKAVHRIRFNYKMTDIEASLGLSQLRKLPLFIRRRRELSRLYGREERTCFRFTISVKHAESTIRRFAMKGIRSRRPVFSPLHRLEGISDQEFPEAAHAMTSLVSVPIYPALREPEVRRIVRVMEEIPP